MCEATDRCGEALAGFLHDKLAAYAGTSGKTGTPMNKAGGRPIRKCLFFPAITAMRHNPACKAHAARLAARGKPSM